MPVAMVRWLAGSTRRLPTPDELSRGAMYELYRRFDAELGAELPAFSAVVDALHDACYRADLVVERLGRRDEALRERVQHARHWLALRAAELCWVVRRLPEGKLAVPDRTAVAAALAALRAGAVPDADASWAARAALFGTYAGPSLAALLDVYPPAETARALALYLDTGDRPLRADVLANLSAGVSGVAIGGGE
jgi:hypothetical protein